MGCAILLKVNSNEEDFVWVSLWRGHVLFAGGQGGGVTHVLHVVLPAAQALRCCFG